MSRDHDHSNEIVQGAIREARSVTAPYDGEAFGDPCPICGAVSVYRLTDRAPGYRIEHATHDAGRHSDGKSRRQITEVQPPRRTSNPQLWGDGFDD